MDSQDVGDAGSIARLQRLSDYCRYVFEQETARRKALHNLTKTYFTIMAFVATSGLAVLRLTGGDELARLLRPVTGLDVIAAVAIGSAAVLFCLAFVISALVVKTWRYEGLCDLREFVERAASFKSDTSLLSAIIADFAIATERNAEVNQRRAKLLKAAMISFLCALTAFAVGYATAYVSESLHGV